MVSFSLTLKLSIILCSKKSFFIMLLKKAFKNTIFKIIQVFKIFKQYQYFKNYEILTKLKFENDLFKSFNKSFFCNFFSYNFFHIYKNV